MIISTAFCGDWVPPVSVTAEEPALNIEVFRLSHDEWLSDIRFKGNYKIVRGWAKSLADGLDGKYEINENLDYDGVEATGFIVKTDVGVRIAKHFTAEPTEKVEGGSKKVSSLGFDEVSVKGLSASLHDKFSNSRESVFVKAREDAHGRGVSYVPGMMSRYEVTPLGPFPIAPEDLLTLRNKTAVKDTVAPLESARVIDKSRTELILSGITDRGNKVERRIIFNNSRSPPSVESVSEKSTRPDGSVFEMGSVCLDFVMCRNGWVAKRVIYAQSGNSDKTNHAFRVRDWISPDLGDVEPTSEDFAMNLSDNSRVLGMTKQNTATNQFDLSSFTREDLRSVSAEKVLPATSTNQFFLVGMLATTAVLFFTLWRLR